MSDIEYWVDPVDGSNEEGDGSAAKPKATIWGARHSQAASDLHGGMKYRGGTVHLMEGRYGRSFVPMPYPKTYHCNPAGQTISERCMKYPPATNELYFPEVNPLIFEAEEEGVILSAFAIDPEPDSDPATWGWQGGPGILLNNVRNVTVNGNYKMEIWGGLPEPIKINNEYPTQPADDIHINNVIIRFLSPNQLNGLYDVARLNKNNGRKIWLNDCIIDPDGTMTVDDIEMAKKQGTVASFAPGLIKVRIA